MLWVSKGHQYLMTKLYQNPGQSGDVPSKLGQNTESSSCNDKEQMMISGLHKLCHNIVTIPECEAFTPHFKL